MLREWGWIGFLGFFAGFVAATLGICALFIAEFHRINLEIIQIVVIVITAIFGFGGIFLQNVLSGRNADYLRNRNIAENILIVKGVLVESNVQREKLAHILHQPLPPGREEVERQLRLTLLKNGYGTFDIFKALPFMTGPELLKGFEGKAIEICLQYGTNFDEFFRILRNETENSADKFTQLQIEIEDCGDKYVRAIGLLDSQYEALFASFAQQA
ncbi:hypothetical protein [uncultured Sneathiella sp.]|uniref:hypothetical protein n=1 Tax=uncultured Sneathiella sp. TaxID=879315 RepID=UPI002598E12B|nr:hypothetical protein [uncultured Sneathiella sp.]